jgi:hypothetical protein
MISPQERSRAVESGSAATFSPVALSVRDPARGAIFRSTERRWNRTIQPWGCHGLLVLKTRWATRPLPLRLEGYETAAWISFGKTKTSIETDRSSVGTATATVTNVAARS